MSEIVFLVEEAPEGGLTARALGYSIYTEADTWDELKSAIQDALVCHFEDEARPRMVRLQNQFSVRSSVAVHPVKPPAASAGEAGWRQ